MTTATVQQMSTLYSDVAELIESVSKLHRFPMKPFDAYDRDMLLKPLIALGVEQLRIGGLTSTLVAPLNASAQELKKAIDMFTTILSGTSTLNEAQVIGQLHSVVARIKAIQ
jgi:hypothetical protein